MRETPGFCRVCGKRLRAKTAEEYVQYDAVTGAKSAVRVEYLTCPGWRLTRGHDRWRKPESDKEWR